METRYERPGEGVALKYWGRNGNSSRTPQASCNFSWGSLAHEKSHTNGVWNVMAVARIGWVLRSDGVTSGPKAGQMPQPRPDEANDMMPTAPENGPIPSRKGCSWIMTLLADE
jgi:hypothetical protein